MCYLYSSYLHLQRLSIMLTKALLPPPPPPLKKMETISFMNFYFCRLGLNYVSAIGLFLNLYSYCPEKAEGD